MPERTTRTTPVTEAGSLLTQVVETQLLPPERFMGKQEGEIVDIKKIGETTAALKKFDDRHYSNSANTAQWIISLPIRVKIKFGDVVNVDDGIADISGTISDWETTNISHYNSGGVYTEDSSGNKEILDGTTTVGMHIYVNVTKN